MLNEVHSRRLLIAPAALPLTLFITARHSVGQQAASVAASASTYVRLLPPTLHPEPQGRRGARGEIRASRSFQSFSHEDAVPEEDQGPTGLTEDSCLVGAPPRDADAQRR